MCSEPNWFEEGGRDRAKSWITPPPIVLFSEPWRALPTDNQENLDFVKFYQPQNNDASHVRILLHGPVGGGKSSFFNSVNSVLQGRITGQALTDTTSGSSFTKEYKTYKIKKDPRNFYSFIFNDTMGFEELTGRGVHVEDIKLVLRGHVKDGYMFKSENQITDDDRYYNSSPSLNDRVHVLVSVIPASSLSLIRDDVVKKLREVRQAASQMGIPQMAVLTKVDQACRGVNKDIKNVYKSKYLKEKVDELSMKLGIPPNCIFLVKNYKSETSPSEDINALILIALRQMINFGEDFLFMKMLFSQPWRTLPTNRDNQEILDFVKSYQPQNNDASHVRILLHGPFGAGKSSFFNSVDSVLQGRITGRALTDTTSGSSFTKEYKTYKIKKGPGNFYSFVFNDTMGFEEQTGKGIHVEDIKLVLRGRVKDGYMFKSENQIMDEDDYYNSSPTLDDRVHVLVSVIPASSLPLISDDVVKKLREVRLAASQMGIPQMAVLTKVDLACPEVKKDIKNVYKSKHLKEKVDEFSKKLGIPPNCIFLVKNYESETSPSEDINALILIALRQMINYGKDFLNYQSTYTVLRQNLYN